MIETFIRKITLKDDDGDLVCIDELKELFEDLPPEIDIKLLSDKEVEMAIWWESGEGLWLDNYGGQRSMFWFSYETKNLYCGSPISGAILIGNLQDATGLSPEQTDRFAEFLASMPLTKQDFSEFKLGQNNNLLNALLSSTTDHRTENLEDIFYELNETLKAVDELVDSLCYFGADKDQIGIISRISAGNMLPYEDENAITLAQRYPGLVTIKGDKWEYNEDEIARIKSLYGTDYGDMNGSFWTRWSTDMNLDAFIKRAQMLQRWCKDIR